MTMSADDGLRDMLASEFASSTNSIIENDSASGSNSLSSITLSGKVT